MKPSEGMWWGIVHSVNDPEKKNRIQAKVPDVLGSEISEWANPDSLMLSKLKVGDKVWIRFLAGDIRHPVYHIPYDKKRAIMRNTLDDVELTHPTGPMRLRAPAGTAYMSGSTSSVNASGGKVHCQGKDASGYVPCVASDFEVGSSHKLKENIRRLDFDPLETIRNAPAQLWNYRPEHGDNRTRVGPIAETLPDLVRRGDHVDLASLVGILWSAVAQQSDRIRDLEEKLNSAE
ncbi:phage baseplate assembly protein V [Streptosporangium sp. NPDC023825]|uniref:phage baseplate assembly protein V n=1 Tax=Streptosporangium sp. NPDC023825 TaxID=3154909 RepID=UPI003440C096